MDGEGFGSDAVRSNWEVYKDAFAPPAPSRRIKAWERAPVSAHAPRLQGQKVWKKVGMRTYSKEDDKENCEAAQEELEKGGMGSRKRLRVSGGKENISNALWQTSLVEEEGGDVMVIGSPKKIRMSMGPGDIDAFVVPRKRTNTNHLITPRKPGRKTHFMEQSLPTNTAGSPPKIFTYSPTKPSPQKIPLNDQEITRDSTTTCTPAKTALQKVVLNGLDQTEEGATVPAEKLLRRRKSLRRSTRRLTHGTTPEQAPAAPAESTKAKQRSEAPAPTLETATEPASDVEHSVVEEAPKSQVSVDYCFRLVDPDALSTEESHESPVPGAVQQQTALESAEAKSPSSQKEVDILAGCSPMTPRASTGDLKEDSLILRSANIPIQASIIFQQDISNDAIDATTILTESFAAAKEIPESQPLVLNRVEIRTEIQFSSSTKVSETPRQRRKTPQRRGSRRSTRSNREDSVPLEDLPGLTTPQIQNAHPNISPAKSRMTKTPSKKSRRPSDQESAIEKHISSQVGMSQDAEPAATASKQNVDIEARAQQLTSTEIEGLVNNQPFVLSLQSEHADITGPINESISSEADYHFEDPNLASTPRVEGEIPSSGAVNVQADVPSENGTATTFVSSESGFLSTLQVLQAEELIQDAELPSHESRRGLLETLEALEPISISLSTEKPQEDSTEETPDELPGSSTPNPSITELVEPTSENAPANTVFDHDDTDMLRNFLTRVKANKAAKAGTSIPKRKRSLPHSPLRLPLGSVDSAFSPSSPKSKDEFEVSLPVDSAAKRKMDDAELGYDEATQPKSIRRSGRTRLPVKAAPLAAPSFIPVRRLGQDGDNTITLRRNEEKELAALTRINTRKNKAGAQLPLQVLAKQAEEKEDPASRQRALKEVFDEKALKQKKGKKGKSVVWAEELAQFQIEEGNMAELDKEPEKEKEKAVPVEEKKTAVKVGVRSKMTLGTVNNGTPAPNRKARGRT